MIQDSLGIWHGAVIEADLSVHAVEDTETIAQCASASQVSYSKSEVDRAIRRKIPLTEENVETLLIATLGHVFDGNDLMLIGRQRALLQIPDLIAIDPIGRLTIIELKNTRAKAIEIVSQVNEYLVQCAQRDVVELKRLMQDYYTQYPIFHPLYHAGLLLRRCVEHRPGLGRFLRESGFYPDQKQDASSGGDAYRRKMADIAKSMIEQEHDVDIFTSGEKLLQQIHGDLEYARTGLLEAMSEQFRYSKQCESVLRQTINRRWRQVYFAPSFWFQDVTRDSASDSLTGALRAMYLRGMEITFIEYSLVCRERHSPPWLLVWRTTDEWLSGGSDSADAIAWQRAGAAFDIYTESLLRKGCLVKKWSGRYGNWELTEPQRDCMGVRWPRDGEADNLQTGEVYWRKHSIGKEEVYRLKNVLASVVPEARFSVSIGAHETRLRWQMQGDGPEICADTASRITLTALSLI